MKSKMRRRVIALVLCMVMLLSCGVTTLAEGNTAEPAVTGETAAQENVSAEAQADTASDDPAVVSESQEKMAAAETAETETEETASSDIAVQSETADTEGTESAQTEESTAADTTEQTAGTESGDAVVQSEEETTAGNDTAETSEPETSTENETQADTAEKTEKAAQPYSEKYEDNTIKISVSAEAGIVPEGAKLSVTPIEKTEFTDDMTAEEKAEAEKINDQYELTEKKLNEDSEENEETMEGFLAYDISFLVNGEEVEPSGDVNVVMEFKKAAIPEGVSEDAAVTVKHLKEDETAEDGVVVEDMADKAEVQTTEKAEVEKVELTADSFSTFTITWGNSGYTITVHYVNEKYQEITSDNVQKEEVHINDEGSITISQYARDISGYRYSDQATIGKPDEDTGDATTIYSVRVFEGDLQYKRSNYGQWNPWNSALAYNVYLIYETNDSSTTAKIETIDNISENITINLFNYSVNAANENSGIDKENGRSYGGYNSGINAGRTLKFLSDAPADNQYLDLINRWTGSGQGVRSGIVQNKLEKDKNGNSYPVLVRGNESLDYLFNEDVESVTGKEAYIDTNYLLTKDADGYYSFDSDVNYAEFDEENKVFNVFQQGDGVQQMV